MDSTTRSRHTTARMMYFLMIMTTFDYRLLSSLVHFNDDDVIKKRSQMMSKKTMATKFCVVVEKTTRTENSGQQTEMGRKIKKLVEEV